jgi:uncharacterized protein (TIGR03437 family)
LTLLATAPGLFAANGAGSGPPAAFLILAHADGTQTTTPVFQCDTTCKTVPLDLGTSSDVAVLTLYGTGLSSALNAKVRIGTLDLTPDYAGPQGQFPGLDQVNVRLPVQLRGTGIQPISVLSGTMASNVLQVEF